MKHYLEYEDNEQITLGQLIDLLSHKPEKHELRFDFCYTEPNGLASYRGDYRQLAIGWREWQHPTRITVGEFLAQLKLAVGKMYYGWKGGEYIMTKDTPIWVANSGDGGGTKVVGLAECEIETVIATAYEH